MIKKCQENSGVVITMTAFSGLERMAKMCLTRFDAYDRGPFPMSVAMLSILRKVSASNRAILGRTSCFRLKIPRSRLSSRKIYKAMVGSQ